MEYDRNIEQIFRNFGRFFLDSYDNSLLHNRVRESSNFSHEMATFVIAFSVHEDILCSQGEELSSSHLVHVFHSLSVCANSSSNKAEGVGRPFAIQLH